MGQLDQYQNVRQISKADPGMITRRTFDEENDSVRVTLIGTELPNIILPELKHQEIQVITVPTIVYETKIVEVEKQVIIKEIQIIEVPKYIDRDVIKEIRVPMIHTEVEIIEKPVLITNTEYKDFPTWGKIALLAQFLTTIIMLVKIIK